jgi:putative transposase
MHDQLREAVRVLAGRGPQPTAAIIDSQSVKAADTVGKDSRGYDAGKKIEGRKRHLAVDVMGLILCVLVTAASVQDRDGARPLLWRLAAGFRAVTLIWADGGYAGSWSSGRPARCTVPCRSSSAQTTCTPSRSCPAAGSLSGRSDGS